MIKGLAWSTFTLFFFATQAASNSLVLSDGGTMLGRVSVSDLEPQLQLTVGLGDDEPEATYVIARFQNNRPQQRRTDGSWVHWNETTNGLIDNALALNDDGTLTFPLTSVDLSQHFLPITFTVAYRTEGGLKSGYVVVDR